MSAPVGPGNVRLTQYQSTPHRARTQTRHCEVNHAVSRKEKARALCTAHSHRKRHRPHKGSNCARTQAPCREARRARTCAHPHRRCSPSSRSQHLDTQKLGLPRPHQFSSRRASRSRDDRGRGDRARHRSDRSGRDSGLRSSQHSVRSSTVSSSGADRRSN